MRRLYLGTFVAAWMLQLLTPVFALNDTIGVTAGSGKTANLISFGSTNVISEVGICDATTENRCAVVSAAGAVKVDGSAVTQPVSGTFWQATQPVSGTFFQATQPVSGTVSATVSQATSSSLKAQVDPLTAASWALGAFGATMPTNGQGIGLYDGTNMVRAKGDETSGIWVNIKAGAGSGGTALADEAAFTQGATNTTPSSCLYTTSVTNLTTGQAGVARCTNDRQQLVSDAALLTAAQAGTGLTGMAVPASAIYVGSNALSAEPAATTTGDLTGYFLDLAGKTVTSPYANRENMLRCAVTITSSSSPTTCTGMGAQGASVKIYVTDLTCTRSDAGTTAAQATLNDSATTVVDMPNNGGGGGYAHSYLVPLVVAANTAFQVTTASLASVHCSATGFKGY